MKRTTIIIKKLRGKLSEKQSVLFDNWLASSETNKKLFYSLLSFKGKGADIEKLAAIDTEKAWLSVLNAKNKVPVKKKVIKLPAWTKYAASIALLLSVGYYLTQDLSSHPQNGTLGEDSNFEFLAIKKEKHSELIFNTLYVPNGESFEMSLSDGTQVKLNSGSSIMYPIHFIEGKERIVYLEGEAFFDVTKDASHPFIVHTKNMNVRVLGTQFSVSSYENNSSTHVVLVEGAVKAYPSGEKFYSKNSVLLKPNQMVTLMKSSTALHVEEVNTKHFTSWMQKGINFRDAPFKDVLNEIERHFDVKIECETSVLKKCLFTASFGNENLEQVLKTIQRYKYFDFSIIDNQVLIKTDDMKPKK